jgi:SAM-dependent methyltransferase
MKSLYSFLLRIVRAFRAFSYAICYTGYFNPLNHAKLLVKHAEKGKVLDAGAGGGQYQKLLSGLGTYVSVDIVSNNDVVASLYRLPFKDNTFDSVGCFMVLEHLAEPALAMLECNRVLRRGGTLLLTTPQYWHFHSWPNDYFRYTKEGLRYLSKKANFEIVHIHSMGGPFLVLFHVIDVNFRLYGGSFRRLLIYTPLMLLFNTLDSIFFRHEDRRSESDSVGWALVARKL